MKAILLLVTSLLMSGSFAQMVSNKVNVYTLLVDYDNPQFEGGNLSYYDCDHCSNDSLPFMVNYTEPGDIGSMAFTLGPSGDTLFYGSIFWMGQGQVSYPSFSNQPPFLVQDETVPLPDDVVYYDMEGRVITTPQFINSAEYAWYEVNHLEVVKTAIDNGFKVGMYMYAPEVGVFNAEEAKWVIFLYRNVQALNSPDQILGAPIFSLYPNPAKSIIHISQEEVPISHFEIRNNQGQLLQSGNLDSHDILLTGMSDGIYFLDLRDGDNLVQRIRFQKF